MIEVKKLSYSVSTADDNLSILKDIDCQIDSGQSVAIVGSSGSGKTTLLGIMAGLDLPTSGEIFIDNQRIDRMSEDQRAHFRLGTLGFVFQSFHLLPSLSALENVMLPLQLSNDSEARSKALKQLELVNLQHRLHHYPSQLSGGEQQRVALARAFVTSPKYLFADEPTGNLDENTGDTIIDLLFALNQQQDSTLILVTHEQRLAQRCDRVLLMKDGCLSE